MEIEIIGTYYGIFMILLIVVILIFNLLISIKYKKLFDILVKYPKLEKEMLAFRRFHNPYGFVPFAHSDYIIPIIKRFFLLEAFSKTKTKEFYKKFYRYDSIEKINNKEIKKNIDFILKYAPISDILGTIFFMLFVLNVIVGIAYSFFI